MEFLGDTDVEFLGDTDVEFLGDTNVEFIDEGSVNPRDIETTEHQDNGSKKKATENIEKQSLDRETSKPEDSKLKLNVFHTEFGLCLILPGLCQNSVDADSQGSSACMGICLLLVERFFKEPKLITAGIPKFSQTYAECVKLGYHYWKDNELASMDFPSALKLPLFENLASTIDIVSDTVWHTKLQIGGFKTGEEAVTSVFNAVSSDQTGAFILTFYPDKTLVVVYDKRFNCVLFDSHLHYTAPEESLNFEQALKREDLRGMIVSGNSNLSKELISYLFNTITTELRVNVQHGNIVWLKPKN